MENPITKNLGKNFIGSIVKWVGSPIPKMTATRKIQGFRLGDTALVLGQSVTELEVFHEGQHRHLHIVEVEEV